MRLSVYQETQETQIVGRKGNQERMGYSFTRDALLLPLTDGMGAHPRSFAHREPDRAGQSRSFRTRYPSGSQQTVQLSGCPNMQTVELSRRVSLQVGDVMLLCSEGLWSMLLDHVLAKQLLSSTIVRAVPELVSTALGIAGKSSDNVTALVMAWGSDPNMDDLSSSIVTHALPIGSLTMPIQAPRLGAIDAADGFTDADIDRAIAEIRGAIEKNI